MRAWLKDIKGQWVVAQAEGRVLGTIHTVYIDQASKRVTGFLIRHGNPLNPVERWVGAADITQTGEDLIFVSSAAALQASAPLGSPVTELIGRAVATQNGKILGEVSDIEVDSATWAISELGIGPGQGVPVDLDHMVMGADVILVQSGAEAEVADRSLHKQNFFTALFREDVLAQASEALKRIWQGTEAKLPKPPTPPGSGPKDSAS